MIGICNLCKEKKELQKKCHVIPDFFYRDTKIYTENHNLIKYDISAFLDRGEMKIISNNQKSGEYDLYKYCKNCDGVILNKYESYVKKFFYSDSEENKGVIRSREKGYLEAKNINYAKLKLLFLSILWRAHVSEREIFSEIDLGDKAEDLRKMILHENPKSDKEYPIFVMHTYFDNKITEDFLFQPIKLKFGREKGFLFAFAGMIIIYTYGVRGVPELFLEMRLNENGIFRTINLPPGKTWQYIRQWYNK